MDEVRTLLAAAGLTVPDDELAEIAGMYPVVRGMADLLYTVGEARYEVPGQRFEVEPG